MIFGYDREGDGIMIPAAVLPPPERFATAVPVPRNRGRRNSMSRLSLAWRLFFLVGFVVAVPLLALPSVTRRLDEILYGDEKTATGEKAFPADQADSTSEQEIVRATFEVPLSDSSGAAGQSDAQGGLDRMAGPPPELAPQPVFVTRPLSQPSTIEQIVSPAPSSVPSSNDSLTMRTAQIQQRLEDLGADYILLEALEETGEHRFECRMLVAPGSTETETFEATGNDGVAVAEQVLSAVEQWRSSQPSLLR